MRPWQVLVVEPPRNEWSVVAGTFRARRGRADVCDLLQAAATPRGAFRRPPEGRAHKRPSIRMRGIPPRAPRLRAPLSALDVCPIRPRADAAHLDACGRADHSFLGGSTTSVLCHKYVTFQRAAQGLWLGAARRTYPAYGQGSQQRHSPCAARPSGGRKTTDGGVAALAKVQTFAADRALPSAVLRPLKCNVFVTQDTSDGAGLGPERDCGIPWHRAGSMLLLARPRPGAPGSGLAWNHLGKRPSIPGRYRILDGARVGLRDSPAGAVKPLISSRTQEKRGMCAGR